MTPLQKKIIAYEHVLPEIDPQKEIDRSVSFLKRYLLANPALKTYVLGISGGQDSTLAGKLAQMAIAQLRQETGDSSYRFIAVRIPYGTQADEQDAMDAIAFQKPDVSMRVNIKASVDAMAKAVSENDLVLDDFNKGNLKARARMMAQYAIAGQTHGVVIGTDHAAENVTGFFTKFGDGAADVVPLFRLNKRQGKAMLKLLKAPEHLYLKAPTADLEEDRPDLPDEVALGVTYDQIDDYLEGRSVSKKASDTIERWWRKGEHKRHEPVTVFDLPKSDQDEPKA